MQEISTDVRIELKKLEEEMDAALRDMCSTYPAVLISRDLKAAM